MKRLIITMSTAIVAVACICLSSCSHFDELNENPNQITYGNVTPSKLLQDVLYSGHWTVFYRSWRINGQLMQYNIQTNGQELTANYDVRATESETLWNNLYRWASGASHMAVISEAQGDANMQAIGLTLKVYLSEAITSIFGDIPYSEAFKWDELVHHPKYDSQEEVYTKMISELELANSLYDVTLSLDYPERDLLYQGDIARWKKFTNSLRMRLLMRCSKCAMTALDPCAEMQKMLSDPDTYPLFSTNADGAIFHYTGVNPNYNGFGPTTSTDPMTTNMRLCATFVNKLMDSADPRLSFMAKSNNGEYIGLEAGQTNDYIALVAPTCCNFNSGLSTDTAPSTLMNYAELLFIEAEAQLRGLVNTGKSTKDLYDAAVTASVRQWIGREDWTPGVFLQEPSTAAYNGSIERIMDQKYLATFLCGYEAWCDYRRTGLPVMKTGPAHVNKDASGNVVLPTRLRYPLITQTSNYDNWMQAVSALETGDDDMLSRVWFAKGVKY